LTELKKQTNKTPNKTNQPDNPYSLVVSPVLAVCL